MYTFQAGKGINATKINSNFNEVKQQANTNEGNINTLSSTALLKDGSNMTTAMVEGFYKQPITSLTGAGTTLNLSDNSSYYIKLTANGNTINLPVVANDGYSHTITAIVEANGYSLNLGTTYHLLNDLNVSISGTYYVMWIYNKLNNKWYYSITQ